MVVIKNDIPSIRNGSVQNAEAEEFIWNEWVNQVFLRYTTMFLHNIYCLNG